MNRSFQTQAVVISLKPSGENNSTVTLLTKEHGIIYATLYGGPKSRMKSLVAQWNSGTVYLYDNPEKKQTKISDFDVKNYHASFSQNLFKTYAASLAVELAVKTKCAGSPLQCWTLTSGFLDGLEIANEEQGRVGLIRFLWRFLELMGVQPACHCCGSCGTSFLDSSFAPESQSYYNSIENNFICSTCGTTEKRELMFPVKLSALRYLAGVSYLTPGEVRKLQIDRQDYLQLRAIVFFLIENAVESKLNSIETGVGIL